MTVAKRVRNLQHDIEEHSKQLESLKERKRNEKMDYLAKEYDYLIDLTERRIKSLSQTVETLKEEGNNKFSFYENMMNQGATK